MAEAVLLQHMCKLFFEIGLAYDFFELHGGKDKRKDFTQRRKEEEKKRKEN